VLAVDEDGEVTSAASTVDLKRPLAGALPTDDLRLEHGVDLAPATEAVDLRRAGGSGAASPSPLDPAAWAPPSRWTVPHVRELAPAAPRRWRPPWLPPRRGFVP